MPEFEVINSCGNKTGTKLLDLFRLTDSFDFKLRLVQFSLIVIRSAKRYDLVKKKSDSAYDSVAYKVSGENYVVVTLVRRSDRSVFHNINMPQCLAPCIAIGLFHSFSLHCMRRSRKRSRKIKTFRFLGLRFLPLSLWSRLRLRVRPARRPCPKSLVKDLVSLVNPGWTRLTRLLTIIN